jgi:prepilin-type N-terminal cleavage/methylation domain-containing protein
MVNINYKKGFTLIELLVVISIIGLLSSIVLASLNTTRVKAADAAIKENLRGIISSSEIEYSTLGYSYNTTGNLIDTTTCSALLPANTTGTILQNTSIQAAINDIKKNNGGIDITCNIPADGKSYTITAKLKTPSTSASVNNSSGNVSISTASVPITISSLTAVLYGTNQVRLGWSYNNQGSGRSATNIPPLVGPISYVFEYSVNDTSNFIEFYTNNTTIAAGPYVYLNIYPSTTFPQGTTYYIRSKVVFDGQSSPYTTGLVFFTTP